MTRTLPTWWWIVTMVLVVASLIAVSSGWRRMVQLGNTGLVSIADSAQAREAVLKIAAGNVRELLTYTLDTVEADTTAALALTTGEFHY